MKGLLGGALAIAVLAGCEKDLTDAEYLSNAKELWNQGDFKGSVIELKNALGKNPDNPEARLLLGQVYLRLENGTAAEKELRRAMELNIPLSALAVELAQALLLQDEYQKMLDQVAPDTLSDARARSRLLALRASAFLGLEKRGEAEQSVQEALALNAAEPEALLGLARLALLRGDTKEALTHVDKALAADKDYLPAWLLKGEVFRFEQDVPQARQTFDRAVELDGESVRARIGRALAALAGEDYKQADADAQKILGYYKSHPLATYVRGIVFFRENKFEEALAQFQKVEQLAPNFKPLALWLSTTHAALKQSAQASEYANKYLKMFPDSAEARKLVATLELQQNQPKDALAVLTAIENTGKGDPQLLNLLGMAYAGSGNLSKGADYLREAVEATPQNAQARAAYSMVLQEQGNPAAAMEQLQIAVNEQPELADQQLLLVQKMIQKRQLDEAGKALDQIMKQRPQDPNVMNLHGVLLLAKGQTAEAVKEFEKTLQLSKGFPYAAHNLAIIALRNKDQAKARSYYMETIAKYPEHASTLIALYSLDKGGGKNKDALAWLEQAGTKHPEHPAVAALLAREYSAHGQHLKALTVTEQAAKKHPDDAGLLEARGIAQMGNGQASSAVREFNRWVEIAPGSADARFYLGQAQMAMDSHQEARKSFEKTLALAPGHFGASAMLAKLQLLQGDVAKARQLAAEMRSKYPKSSEGWLVESDALMLQKQYSAAAQIMRELIAKGGAHINTENTLRLARAQWAAGNRQEAVEQVRVWIKNNPKDASALIFMAESQTALGQKKEAMEIYERLMKIVPDNLTVLNNFAWLLKDDSASRALTLADKAYQLAPREPAIADTFGMVLLANKQNARAVDVLASVARQTDNPNVHYHHALALARDGRRSEAKGIVEKLVKDGRSYSEKPAAQALLKELSIQ